jgi:hypothetical protein
VTNKGIFYEHGKEPPLDAPPKLHLLIESNDEFRVRHSPFSLPMSDHGPLRLNKLSERSSGCSLKRRQQQCRRRFAVLIKRQGAIAFSRQLS